MKKLIIISVAILTAGLLNGQTVDDVLLFSKQIQGSTTRSISMAGSFGALGGDFSSLSLNPAGIGVYRSSEFTFTPGFVHSNISSEYYNNPSKDQKYKMTFDNIGWVGAINTGNESGVVQINLGFGYNRLGDFNNNVDIEGVNPNSSYVDYLVETAYGEDRPQESLNGLTTGPAYDAYLLDLDSFNVSNNLYFPYIWLGEDYTHPGDLSSIPYSGDILQIVQKNTKGHIGEWVFSGGINYNHKLYVGGTFAVNKLTYTEKYTLSEFDDNYTGNSYDYISTYKMNGTGYTLKTGIIAKPINILRLGASIHFPTFYFISDEVYTDFYSYFSGGYEGVGQSNIIYNDYKMITPFKFVGSVGLQIKKLAVFNIDWETLDYSNTQIRDQISDQAIRASNSDIISALSRVHNIRLGGEIRIDNMALRAGYALYGSGYKVGEDNASNNLSIISAGIGFRNKHSYFDIGYSVSLLEDIHNLYSTEGFGDNLATNTIQRNKIVATIGFRF